MRTSREPSPEFLGCYPSEQGALCDVFVKLGGSILDHDAATAALVPQVIELARKYRILILSGGGQAAKRIKANQRSSGTHFYTCWRAGVLCLEVNAHLLASYSPHFTVVSSLPDMAACFASGNIGVFAPLGAIVNSLYLVPDWEATTDSIGLHFASALGALRYVIVSDVDGIYNKRPGEMPCGAPIPSLSVDELERLPTSKLDPAFSAYFRRQAVPTVIVNGRHPHRVSAAIRGEGTTIGTRIDVTKE
jgi:5-(aminomethyl)-3-furanmethanol phosphate kinase